MENTTFNDKKLLDDNEQKKLFTTLDMTKYIFILSCIFYFISFKVVNVFVIIIWVFLHIISHKHFFTYLTNIASALSIEYANHPNRILFQFLLIILLISRTIALLIYSYGYSSLLLKFQQKGQTYDIPKRYRYFETEYKKLYIIGSYIIFAILGFFTFFKKDLFTSLSIDLTNNTFMSIINILCVSMIFFFSYLATDKFNSINAIDRIIYTLYVFVLISICILLIKKGIDFITNTILNCKIFMDNKDEYVSGFFKFLTQIIGFSSLALLTTTTVFEFIYAYRYQKLQSKY